MTTFDLTHAITFKLIEPHKNGGQEILTFAIIIEDSEFECTLVEYQVDRVNQPTSDYFWTCLDRSNLLNQLPKENTIDPKSIRLTQAVCERARKSALNILNGGLRVSVNLTD